jgi:hypothetical protein
MGHGDEYGARHLPTSLEEIVGVCSLSMKPAFVVDRMKRACVEGRPGSQNFEYARDPGSKHYCGQAASSPSCYPALGMARAWQAREHAHETSQEKIMGAYAGTMQGAPSLHSVLLAQRPLVHPHQEYLHGLKCKGRESSLWHGQQDQPCHSEATKKTRTAQICLNTCTPLPCSRSWRRQAQFAYITHG